MGEMFRVIMRATAMPTEWGVANVVLIWKKKGDRGDVRYYRPISLVNRLRMLWEAVLAPWVGEVTGKRIDVAQGGVGGDTARDTLLPHLRLLFDHNYAQLLVRGAKSGPIYVRRGLLQGTVLAPPLFNVHINSLPAGLREAFPGECTKIGGLRINSVLCADDTTVMGSPARLGEMTEWCHEWGTRNGVEFQAAKGCYLGPEGMPRVTMGGVDLPRVESAVTLGMVMTLQGVDMVKSLGGRIKRARQVAGLLLARGVNSYGFWPRTSLRHINTFIRPIMEYGLALRPLTATEIAPLE